MHDPRIDQLARQLIRFSTGVRKGDRVMLDLFDAPNSIALALILMLYKRRKSLDVSVWQEMREPDQEPIEDEGTLPPGPKPEAFEHLTPAGAQPPATKETEEVSHV